MTTEPLEVEIVENRRVSCDGGNGGHPRVWLKIPNETNEVECSYCQKKFVLTADALDH